MPALSAASVVGVAACENVIFSITTPSGSLFIRTAKDGVCKL